MKIQTFRSLLEAKVALENDSKFTRLNVTREKIEAVNIKTREVTEATKEVATEQIEVIV